MHQGAHEMVLEMVAFWSGLREARGLGVVSLLNYISASTSLDLPLDGSCDGLTAPPLPFPTFPSPTLTNPLHTGGGLRDPNVVAVRAFYGDDLKVNFCGKLASDSNPQVRVATVIVWIKCGVYPPWNVCNVYRYWRRISN